jgi:carbon-monoxide dehydrogenase iron sulfur subunit
MVIVEKCLACKSCEIACAVAHSKSAVLEQAITESPKPQKRVTVEPAEEYAIPIQCRHCEDAPCIEICPTGAIQRFDKQAPVVVDADLCIGCKLCMLICPFGILQISSEGRSVVKCDMCYEHLKEGKVPKCVEACPTKALQLVSLKELAKSKRQKASKELIRKSYSKKNNKL